MNIYSIYIKGNMDDSDPILVKQGFSFIAAIFNIFWSLYHRMWLFFMLGLIVSAIPSFFEGIHFFDRLIAVTQISTFLIFGFLNADMREYALEKSGYELYDVVVASDEKEAEMKFFARAHSPV